MAEGEIIKNVNIIVNANYESGECNFSVLTAAFRVLRNYCASGRHAQTTLARYSLLLHKTHLIARYLLHSSREHGDLSLLVCLQFVANFVVDNKANQIEVWGTFSEALQAALRYQEPKIQNCAAMIVYNVLLDNEDLLQQIDEPLEDIIQLTQNEVTAEYAVFILELFVCKTKYVERQYKCLQDSNKVIVLSVIESVQKTPEGRQFPPGMVPFFGKYFVEKSHCVLETAAGDMEASDAEEVAVLLDLINSISSSNGTYLTQVQSVPELLVHGIGLLRNVHALSKEKGNQFSMLLKMADLEADRNDALEEQPGFGFKAALVRLIGNMCWREQGHQDTAREMGAIPLILDCCNIDARNPLIIQWAVLAMRNLCEGNLENQRVVACVDRRGQVDSGRLADLGLLFNGAGQS